METGRQANAKARCAADMHELQDVPDLMTSWSE